MSSTQALAFDSDLNEAVQQESSVGVSVGVRFNNQNWFTTPHPQPETFTVKENGEAYGTTTTGIPFTQTNFSVSSTSARIQVFTIQDHSHYIVEGEIAYSEEELNTLIARFEEKSNTNSVWNKLARVLN